MMAQKHNKPQLPSHLSHKSSLVLLPPSSITAPIESLRQQHDKQFHRWPPHINLIYPFLSNPSDTDQSGSSSKILKPEIRDRIKKALGSHTPFMIFLEPAGTFHHGRKSATVWLRPTHGSVGSSSTPTALHSLHSALQDEFRECNADTRLFTPHLSIGQVAGRAPAEELVEEAEDVVEAFLKSENEVGSEERNSLNGLEWLVDRVYVIEREGYNDRFKVVGEIMFPTEPVDSHEVPVAGSTEE
jgi:2'-5' RNA ligase